MPSKEPLDTEGHGAEAGLPASSIQEKVDKNNAQALVESDNCLSLRMKNPICKVGRIIEGLSDKDDCNIEEILSASAVKLPQVERIPRYSTWIFSRRNQMMAADQSFIRKKLIYYEGNSHEPHSCSESEEEPEQEYNTEREVSQDRAGKISAAFARGEGSSNIQENSDRIMEDDQLTDRRNFNNPVEDGDNDAGFMDKSLAANLDTFNRLFCRTCLIFDCRLHGNGSPEDVICPKEKQSLRPEEDSKPCGPHCYRLDLAKSSAVEVEATEERSNWTLFEKDMYWKGIEVFGRNSCNIVRNLLAGHKTCREVANYMNDDGAEVPHPSGGKLDDDHMEPILPDSSRPIQRKGSRNRKSSWKSGSHPSRRKLVNVKGQLPKKYSPCRCEGLCGKDCPCEVNGTYCEKLCGCSKACKNRFRGCLCTISQCRTTRCPCFAANRECDPDVCKNCWVSCGDGTLGAPPGGPSGRCSNMNILLGKHQRILLGISDVEGWGAFLKNPASKNDFLGEYTGELISHEEAERRGKAYDRANKSYLFNLNDELVIDAYRIGNKLRFVNHSSEPNCYAKIMVVRGDHHVGIYAKRNIEAFEELLCDYGSEWSQKNKTQPESASK